MGAPDTKVTKSYRSLTLSSLVNIRIFKIGFLATFLGVGWGVAFLYVDSSSFSFFISPVYNPMVGAEIQFRGQHTSPTGTKHHWPER